MRLNFDLETNGLLSMGEDLKIHCMAVKDVDSGKEWAFVNSDYRAPADGGISDGLALLDEATVLSGHNIVSFDLPTLKIVCGWEKPHNCAVYDTYVAAMLTEPDVGEEDHRNIKRAKRLGRSDYMPGNYIGRHSLAAWGYRLGVHKGEYGQNRTDWSTFDLDMLRYCVQDVRVCVELERHLHVLGRAKAPVLATEQAFSRIMSKQEQYGFPFNSASAEALVGKLEREQSVLAAELQDLFPPRTVVYFTPVKKLRREKTVLFNPTSRTQIADNLIERYGWVPKEHTKKGTPKVTDAILAKLPWPEAQKLARNAMLSKRIAQISSGRQGWLKKVGDDGRMHGRVINIGTPHGRCGHSNPNVAQIPGAQKEFGMECRAMFHAGEGRKLVGIDIKGAQLRGLAHYLFPYDDGHYVDVVTKQDPHTVNMEAAGLEERAHAKTFIYAYLFGAGDEHIGYLVKGLQGNKARKFGKSIKDRFLKRLPGLKELRTELAARAAKRGWLRGLDGRYIPVRSQHVALNYILTGFEAAIMKRATVLADSAYTDKGWTFGEEWANVAHVHDEAEISALPEVAQESGEIFVASIEEAGRLLHSNCPMTGDFKVGETWADTH